MPRSLLWWHRDRGSALIEALVIGSAVFAIVAAAIGASIAIAVRSGEAREAAEVAVVHAARHDDLASAERIARELYSGHTVAAARVGDSFVVTVSDAFRVAHPESPRSVDVAVAAVMPLAPFRSDRG